LDIYQDIWDADMKNNGLLPIQPGDKRDFTNGYVLVDHKNSHPHHKLIKDVHIPASKRRSYKMVERLFDNYTLDQYSKEKNTRKESKEVSEFLGMAVATPPMKMAKEYVENVLQKSFTELHWYTHLHQLWFRQFNLYNGRDLSGFEHIFIGEQKRKMLSGHHFWYKYWLEDSPALNKHKMDLIELKCSSPNEWMPSAPFVVTAGYRLKAFDHHKRQFIKISKSRCGFFVGLSAEGLMALGTVRALFPEEVPHFIKLNGVKLNLEMFMCPEGKSIRTFYPLYQDESE
jgi:poly(U)-specific endoribonuclease